MYDLMTPLMPNLAAGSNVYRASVGTHGAANSTLTHGPEVNDNSNTGNASTSLHGAADEHGQDGNEEPVLQSSPPLPPSSPSLPTRDIPTLCGVPTSLTSTSYPSATGSTSVSTMSCAAKRKQSVFQASQSNASVSKKQRTTSGTVALNGIKESLDTFNSTIGRNLGLRQLERERADTSPERRAKAMDLLQEQETYLDDDRMIAFIDLFRADTAVADAYLAIKRDGLRRKWVEKQLKEMLGFPSL